MPDEKTDLPTDLPHDETPAEPIELPTFEPEPQDEIPETKDSHEATQKGQTLPEPDEEGVAAPDAEPASGAPAMPEDVPTPEPEEKAPEEKKADAGELHGLLCKAEELIPGLKSTDQRLHGALMELEIFLQQFKGKLKGAIDGTLAGI